MQVQLFFSDYECRDGYEQKEGALGGGKSKLPWMYKSLTRVNAYECEDACDLDENCKSYHYSSSWHQCKLQTVADPLVKRNFRDFVWCTKSKYALKPVKISINHTFSGEEYCKALIKEKNLVPKFMQQIGT